MELVVGKGREEAIAVCSEKNMGTGITVWDISTGDNLLNINTCASNPHGMLCLRNTNNQYFLFASQAHKHGSVGGGSISMWCLTKPQTPIRSYPLEAIGPLACTKDGLYLSGGAQLGNAYIWEVPSGKLLKSWRAHNKSLTCMLFSDDNSILISGSDDGLICVWSMISLLDVRDSGTSSPLYYCSSEHNSSITGLSITSGISSPLLISSSLDGTFKVLDLVSGQVVHTVAYPIGITASVLHPSEHIVFCGSADGRIFINNLHVEESHSSASKDQPNVLQGHNGAITALAFSGSGLVSASEDCTICVWDYRNWTITQKINHKKGPVTNLVVIPKSSLSSGTSNRRASNTFRVAPLEKYPQTGKLSNQTVTLQSSSRSFEESAGSSQQALDSQLQKEWTQEALQMRVETCLHGRIWAMKMARDVMKMNRHLQSRLLDLMQTRMSWSDESNENKTKKRKKLTLESPCESNNNGSTSQKEDPSKSPSTSQKQP